MRIYTPTIPLCLQQRPYAGGLGASLYLGSGDPDADPGPSSILFRRNRILFGGAHLVFLGTDVQLGGASIPKTPAVAQVTSPTAEINYSIPEYLEGKVVWAQIRTFKDDVENESIYRPRRIVLDGDGELDDRILGTAYVTELIALDGGGLTVKFIYSASRDGAQPVQFVLSRTAGPTSPSPATTPFVAGQRQFELTIASLQDAGAYTFTLSAEGDTTSADLVTGIAFTADGSGPPAVSSLTATEY